MKQMVLAFALVLTLSGLSRSEYEKGAAAFDQEDYAVALQELQAPAGEGDARAQFLLGVMHGMGLGVPQDYAASLMWLRNAAFQGNANAQSCLGVIYDEGKGVNQDYAEAARWYLKAAEQGNANAQYSLGTLLHTGKGMPHDNVKAHLWYNLAAARGLKEAEKARDEIAKKMTPQQISKAQELARNWKPVSNPADSDPVKQ
jgi:TPR repeat protein